MISNMRIGDLTIDCADARRARGFYSSLMGWKKTMAYGCLALETDHGMIILFAQGDVPYEPPVWPEEPGKQQKQMHLDFTVDNVHSAVKKAIRLGAVKAVEQYGGERYVTMLDTEGHPFCLCKRPPNDSEFVAYYEKMDYGAIPDVSINIDCKKSEELRAFYARMTDWDQNFHPAALLPENRMVIHFMGCEGDFEYVSPLWPEEYGQQQKQMHFNFQVDNVQLAVEEALRLGAKKASEQFGAEHFVTMLDTEGHPFCLCLKD